MRAMMISLAMVCSAACGATDKPVLANAPHPDPAAVAGGAAAAAAAMTLADPDAATRGKPEKPTEDKPKEPIEVKEHVPASALDRLDQQHAQPTAAEAKPAATPRPKPAKHRGPPPKIPSPRDAAEREQKSDSGN